MKIYFHDLKINCYHAEKGLLLSFSGVVTKSFWSCCCGVEGLEGEVYADDEPWMPLQEVVAPEIDVPVLDGVIEACGKVHVLVELPGMYGSDHWGNGVSVLQGDGIAQILVVRVGVRGVILYYPPSVGAPKEAAIVCDGSVQVEGRRQVGEPETVVQVERGCDLCSDAAPFVVGEAVADECSPIGTVLACVEVHTCGEAVAQSVLEGGVGLLVVDAGPDLQGSVAVKLAIAHGSSEIGNLGDGFCR